MRADKRPRKDGKGEFVVLEVMSDSLRKRTIFSNPDDLAETGFHDGLLSSSVQNAVPVKITFDELGERIVAISEI